MTGSSLLVVPLPGLMRLPRLGADPYPAPFVTLLDPFLPPLDQGTLRELARLFADVVPFTTEVIGVSEFPGGRTYLTPHPAKPFRRLAQAVARAFPEAGHHTASFADSPHVRLVRRPDETLAELQHEIEPSLPVGASATDAALWTLADEEGVVTVHVVATFPFGTSAA